ncbi:MAG: DNA repair protein RecN [Christensenellaceae bacterium]|jgi:DNA repair protein RecN (Recombination protein N)|nr:DNA repair protein RecN [Christensenellaceae bacterium]
MLRLLKIQNLALIPEVEIEFGENLNILTGETGAGKSIILGSFNFILGDKLSASVIRHGETFARVSAVFDDLIITRTLKSDGRSECRVNDEIVTLAKLKELTANLINIHGQHDTEILRDKSKHLDIIDAFGAQDVGGILKEYLQVWQAIGEIKREVASLGGDETTRAMQIDILKYQINEIGNAELTDGEEQEIDEALAKAQNFEKINLNLSSALTSLNNLAELGAALSNLRPIEHIDDEIARFAESLRASSAEIDETANAISDYLGCLEFDEEELKRLDERKDLIKNLKKKYGASIAEILTFLETAKIKLETLETSDLKLEELNKLLAEKQVKLTEIASRLTAARKKKAAELCARVLTHLNDLAMNGSHLEVAFAEKSPSPNGFDDAEFIFSANIGQPLKPLASVISGGEMSRFMLALKIVTADTYQVKTVVFDEIDTGISGKVGSQIAEKMSKLAENKQVIAVTHLAQIAAKATSHFLISKSVVNEKTQTTILPLSEGEQIAEIARIIGGGDSALAHARELKGC